MKLKIEKQQRTTNGKKSWFPEKINIPTNLLRQEKREVTSYQHQEGEAGGRHRACRRQRREGLCRQLGTNTCDV